MKPSLKRSRYVFGVTQGVMEQNVMIKNAAVMQRVETKSHHRSFRAAKRRRTKNSCPRNTFAPFHNNSLLPSLWRTWLNIFTVSFLYLSQVGSFDSSSPALITALVIEGTVLPAVPSSYFRFRWRGFVPKVSLYFCSSCPRQRESEKNLPFT